MTIVVQTGANTPIGTIVDTASVTSRETDPTPADESVVAQTTVATSTDLAVQLTAGPSSVLAGSDLTYTITVTNNRPAAGAQCDRDVFRSPPARRSSPRTAGVPPTPTAGAVATWVTWRRIASASAGGCAGDGRRYAERNGDVSRAIVVDPNPSNNTSTVITQVDPAAAVQVALSSSESPVVLGQRFRVHRDDHQRRPSDAPRRRFERHASRRRHVRLGEVRPGSDAELYRRRRHACRFHTEIRRDGDHDHRWSTRRLRRARA